MYYIKYYGNIINFLRNENGIVVMKESVLILRRMHTGAF